MPDQVLTRDWFYFAIHFFLTDGERIRQEIKNDHHYLTITDLTFGDKGKKFSIIISIVGGLFMKIMERNWKKKIMYI